MQSKKRFVVVIDTKSFRKLFTSRGFWIGVLVLVSAGMTMFAVSLTLNNIQSGDPVSAAPIMANFNILKNAIEQGQVPVGTILAWHKSLNPSITLPDDWVECDGRTITDPDSPLEGYAIPNLNGFGYFLRGATSSGTLQQDAIASHAHGSGSLAGNTNSAGDHIHPYSASGTTDVSGSHSHGMQYFMSGSGSSGPLAGGNAGATTINTYISGNHTHTFSISGTTSAAGGHTHSVSVTSGITGSTGDSETRPKNMGVVWIIKIK
ncbi:MAG: hypothetical protein JW969_07900 [Spirochaetales bacterium]|nr:hypothetical protein [Spirochaetales bacterium]